MAATRILAVYFGSVKTAHHLWVSEVLPPLISLPASSALKLPLRTLCFLEPCLKGCVPPLSAESSLGSLVSLSNPQASFQPRGSSLSRRPHPRIFTSHQQTAASFLSCTWEAYPPSFGGLLTRGGSWCRAKSPRAG